MIKEKKWYQRDYRDFGKEKNSVEETQNKFSDKEEGINMTCDNTDNNKDKNNNTDIPPLVSAIGAI